MNKLTIKSMLAATMLVAFTSCSSSAKQETSADTDSNADAVENVVDNATKPVELGPDDILLFDGPIPSPVVVDFSATWCGPCKMMHPIFDKLAEKYAGQVNFIYVDIDKCPALASQYEVEAIPTLLFVATDGKVNKNVGFMDEAQLEAAIQEIINASKVDDTTMSPR